MMTEVVVCIWDIKIKDISPDTVRGLFNDAKKYIVENYNGNNDNLSVDFTHDILTDTVRILLLEKYPVDSGENHAEDKEIK